MCSKPKDENSSKSDRNERLYTRNDVLVRLLIYSLIVMGLVIVWLLTSHDDSSFFSHFSFASTVTSIILSVLAIIMSVTESSKTQTIREKIESEADEITKLTATLQIQINALSDKMDSVQDETKKLRMTVNQNKGSYHLGTGGTAGKRIEGGQGL